MFGAEPGQTTQPGGQIPFSKRKHKRKMGPMASNPAQALPPAQETAPRLGERLLAKRLINEGQLKRALDLQPTSSRPLGRVLIELGALDEDRLTAVLGEHLDVQVADLRREVVDPEVAQLVPEDFARRRVVLPFRRESGGIAVAMADPADLHLVNDLRLITGLGIVPYLAGSSDIIANLSRVHSMRPRIHEAARELKNSRPQFTSASRSMVFELSAITATSPAVEIVNMLITQGLRDRASDVHIVERRRAQDGQISLTVDGRELDIRVATIETIWGEKMVLRLLDRGRSLIPLKQLGFSPGAYQRFHGMLHSPYGMIIVSGPTGSGKTTTLYAPIHELDQQVRNIMTIEDPVEYTFDNINQSQINKLADISFANGLRAILRQDPDIILVGEIRDRETAEIAVQSALTGHLVLSSLHATDAVGALLRFTDMGIEGFLIASSVIAIVAQRLVRKNCEGCKVPYRPTQEDLDFAASLGVAPPQTLFRGQGCSRCNGTGYYDRLGVFEVLTMSDELKRKVISKASHQEIIAAAIEGGMVPLRADAWHKIVAGVTTVSEVLRSVYII